ncbi:MAG TPA: DUF5682 family protein [Acidimicrobiales bacterium]|nr:DUF5682 family protein [Acidimicrobiales bacterium]
MPATFVGVRHHSPACAHLVRRVIAELRPAHVLVEGPADMNERIDEVLLDHELPIAVFTSYRDQFRSHASWSPLCEHSPEWVALLDGRRAGAAVRFIDLPAWHPAFEDRANRYADAERRYSRAVDRLCRAFAVDNVDTLWDHLFEIDPGDELAERLATYFALVRGEAAGTEADQEEGHDDAEREAYMAEWVRAAVADAGDRHVVVVTGGFHRPALVAAATGGAGRQHPPTPSGWPDVPVFPAGAVGGSYLVPFSFRRLDAFVGYQSGMPSPRYYQRLWEKGADEAGASVVESVVERLRRRRQQVSTADLVAARTMALGLARLRGHAPPGRVDVLDGLVSALVTDSLDRPLPWTGRGRLAPGTEPVVVEMVAALSGEVVGRLHPDTPHPPLVDDIEAELERYRIPLAGRFEADLTEPRGLGASRVLHRLRVLAIPGVLRTSGPEVGGDDPVLSEVWELEDSELRLPSVIEAGSYGATLAEAAAAALGDRFAHVAGDAGGLAALLFDAALCGLDELSGRAVAEIALLVGSISDLGGLGTLLSTALGLWRHDRLLGAAGSSAMAGVIDSATIRALWLVEAIRGGPAPADGPRLQAVVAVRDALIHADSVLSIDRSSVLGVFVRSSAIDRPPDLRGAAIGLVWALDEDSAGDVAAIERSVRSAARPAVLGDFLAGLFALAREQVLSTGGIIGLLDDVIANFSEHDFLIALPALRLAFSWFPPREREMIANILLERRGLVGSGRSLLRLTADPELLAHARAVEARVEDLLSREALLRRVGGPGEGD